MFAPNSRLAQWAVILSCLALGSLASNSQTYHFSRTACEHHHAAIGCPSGHVVSITSAMYGRLDRTTCPSVPSEMRDTSCSAAQAKAVASAECNGNPACRLKASNEEFTDPCYGTFKYLRVEYDCVRSNTRVSCEHETMSLACAAGYAISVDYASYGRQTTEVCARSFHDVATCHADSSIDIVESQCEGRRSCSVLANNAAFGDPCPGVFKYLEVLYKCISVDEDSDSSSDESGSGSDEDEHATTTRRPCRSSTASTTSSSGDGNLLLNGHGGYQTTDGQGSHSHGDTSEGDTSEGDTSEGDTSEGGEGTCAPDPESTPPAPGPGDHCRVLPGDKKKPCKPRNKRQHCILLGGARMRCMQGDFPGEGVLAHRTSDSMQWSGALSLQCRGGLEYFLADIRHWDAIVPGDAEFPPQGSPKKELDAACYWSATGFLPAPAQRHRTIDPTTWTYFRQFSGNLTHVASGQVIQLQRRGPLCQMGLGANGKNHHLGLSCWLDWAWENPNSRPRGLPLGTSGHGDINADLKDCEPAHMTTAHPTPTPSTTPPTVAPSTVQPTTTAPSTVQPTTAAPSTTQPSTTASSTVQPTTVAPSTVQPTTAEPSTVQPTTAAPSTVQPTTVAPSTTPPTSSTATPSSTTSCTVLPTPTTTDDSMGSIGVLTGVVSLSERWSLGLNKYLAGFHHMAQDLSLGGTANAFYSLTSTEIPAGGDISAFSLYVAANGAATEHVDIGSKLTPDSYSALTSADPDVGFGSVNFYFIHHRGTTDYFATLVPGSAVASAVTDLKPMSGPGGPNTVTGVSGYFALTFCAADLGYGANRFYYLRTAPDCHTWFGTTDPALSGTSSDLFDLGASSQYKAMVFVSVDVGYGANMMYYIRLDSVTGFTIFGVLHPGTGAIADISNLGSVFGSITFTPTDLGFGFNKFYTTGAFNPTWQSISFPAVSDAAIGAAFTVTPTASSGLDLTLSVVNGSVGQVSISLPVGGVFTVTPTSPGLVTLEAAQAGAVAPVAFEFNMLRQSFTIVAPTELPTSTS